VNGPLRLVAVSAQDWQLEFAAWARLADAAARSDRLAPPGDLEDGRRYGELAALIEGHCATLAVKGRADYLQLDLEPHWLQRFHDEHHSWFSAVDLELLPSIGHDSLEWVRNRLQQGDSVVVLGSPISTLGPSIGQPGRGLPPAPQGVVAARGTEAADSVGEQRLRRAESGQPFLPSGFANQELSEGLYRLIGRRRGIPAQDIRVVYRDGSEARPLPGYSIDFGDHPPQRALTLRFSLMSIRHPEMDHQVHGAWFRNIDLSRPDTVHAEIDQIAYESTRSRLNTIATRKAGPAVLEIVQSGLEPANVGFYRAVAEFLTDPSTPIAVQPLYVRGSGLKEGRPWTVR
jgi:hypothetical protein